MNKGLKRLATGMIALLAFTNMAVAQTSDQQSLSLPWPLAEAIEGFVPSQSTPALPDGTRTTANPPQTPQNGLPGQTSLPNRPFVPAQVSAPGQIITPTAPFAPVQAITGAHRPDEVLVTLQGDLATIRALAARNNLQIRSLRTSTLLEAGFVRFGIPDGRSVARVLAQLSAEAALINSQPNHLYQLQQSTGSRQYLFRNIKLEPDTRSGANVRVGVIDTGVNTAHPALKGALALTYDALPALPLRDTDHGTTISGLIGGRATFTGLAPGAALYHARAFEQRRSSTDVILDALDWVVEQDVHIINMSFAGPPNPLLEQAINAAAKRNLILVAAAGNSGPGAPFAYPAAYEPVIAITAIDAKNAIMKQANRGTYVFLSAPGVDLIAPVTDGVDLVTGTSVASAVVSGALAGLIAEQSGTSPEALTRLLADTAIDLGDTGKDTDFGHGLINIQDAKTALQQTEH